MSAIVPMWIIGGPFIGLLILSFAFKGPSSMGGGARLPLRDREYATDRSAPVLDPVAPAAPRRLI